MICLFFTGDSLGYLLMPPDQICSEIEDCTEEWSFPPNHFDFIHIRGLVGSIDDWHVLFQRAYNCLKPGGWLESYEISPLWESDDDTIPKDSAMAQWAGIFIEGGRRIGRTFEVLPLNLQRKAMEAAGFKEIQEKPIKVIFSHSLSPSCLFLLLLSSLLWFFFPPSSWAPPRLTTGHSNPSAAGPRTRV